MKLYVYQNDFETVYETCMEVLKQMRFSIRNSNVRQGVISAIHDGGVSSLSSMLDLRIIPDNFSVNVSIISSNVSNIFGTIFQNPKAENEFIDHLFEELGHIHSASEYSTSLLECNSVVHF